MIEQNPIKKNIAIIMGGFTSEYEISLKSGQVVYDTLSKDKYNLYRVHIFKDRWVYVDDKGLEYKIDKNNFSIDVDGEEVFFDCVFNAIHGTPGEDGYIQGYLELLEIPHTSCPMYQAALTYNKRDCLSVLKKYGIKTAKSYYVNKGDQLDYDKIVGAVGLPCFVKANRAGSSFGVSKVHKLEEMDKAFEFAFKEDDQVIVESFLDGIEVSVGVITYKGNITVLPVTEIVTNNDFFDYNAKYNGESQEITPATITDEMSKTVQDLAKKVYEVLELKGFSRSEYIFSDGEPHLLEINSVPGLTTASILPKQAECAGISLEDLFENAINEALKTKKEA
ncbi:D-alanine--D-alanine ligase [Aegicerativicinus sediminis]|uniref:D-alanine--D-alanine ligase n=1 Tax=Aegicerativicinus sediminis TaxID=2893202 RepID=UPI001E3E7701|nr:D-alanine--D-alanine ligase [Aegicerativicinus sediminis]